MHFTLECEQEVDGRWIAEVPELPGVLSYGISAADTISKAEIWLFALSLTGLRIARLSL
jgi:predicted RNase H-like HicB family nuclease